MKVRVSPVGPWFPFVLSVLVAVFLCNRTCFCLPLLRNFFCVAVWMDSLAQSSSRGDSCEPVSDVSLERESSVHLPPLADFRLSPIAVNFAEAAPRPASNGSSLRTPVAMRGRPLGELMSSLRGRRGRFAQIVAGIVVFVVILLVVWRSIEEIISRYG